MPDYPILLSLDGRLCVVVGGGPVGRRKAGGLRAAGARVRLIARGPRSRGGKTRPWRWWPGPFAPQTSGGRLAFAATGEAGERGGGRRGPPAGDPRQPRRRAGPRGLYPAGGAAPRRATLAVGTGGASPALAAELRDRLATLLGPEWGEVVALFAALRQKRLTLKGNPEYNREIVRRLLAEGLAELVADGDAAGIARLLQQLGGGEFSPAEVEAFLPRKG